MVALAIVAGAMCLCDVGAVAIRDEHLAEYGVARVLILACEPDSQFLGQRIRDVGFEKRRGLLVLGFSPAVVHFVDASFVVVEGGELRVGAAQGVEQDRVSRESLPFSNANVDAPVEFVHQRAHPSGRVAFDRFAKAYLRPGGGVEPDRPDERGGQDESQDEFRCDAQCGPRRASPQSLRHLGQSGRSRVSYTPKAPAAVR